MPEQYLVPEHIQTRDRSVYVKTPAGTVLAQCSSCEGATLFADELRRFARTFDIIMDPKSLEGFVEGRAADSREWNPTVMAVDLWRPF